MKNANIEDIRNIFWFSIRMAKFGDNYKNKNNPTMCPLCNLHYDSQILFSVPFTGEN